jgi:hypothetical protein
MEAAVPKLLLAIPPRNLLWDFLAFSREWNRNKTVRLAQVARMNMLSMAHISRLLG